MKKYHTTYDKILSNTMQNIAQHMRKF